MKKISISEIVKIAINCVILPLYFINIFHQVAHLPGFDEEGNQIIGEIDHYYSIFYKLDGEEVGYLVWLAIAICVASIAASAVSIFVRDSKAIKIVSHILFAVSTILFFVLLFISLQIKYKY